MSTKWADKNLVKGLVYLTSLESGFTSHLTRYANAAFHRTPLLAVTPNSGHRKLTPLLALSSQIQDSSTNLIGIVTYVLDNPAPHRSFAPVGCAWTNHQDRWLF